VNLLVNILRVLLLVVISGSLILGITNGSLFSAPLLSIFITICFSIMILAVLIDGLMGKKIRRLDLLRWVILAFLVLGFLGSLIFSMKFAVEVFFLFIPIAAVLIYDLRKRKTSA